MRSSLPDRGAQPTGRGPAAAPPSGPRVCTWCGGATRVLRWVLTDRMFPRPGTFRVTRCTRCGSLLLATPPTRADDPYPADYYSYQHTTRSRPSLLDRLLLARTHPSPEPDGEPGRGPGREPGRESTGAPPRHPPPEPARALDVGCGAGHALGDFSRRGWRTFGTEVSLAGARRARRHGHQALVGELGGAVAERELFEVIRLQHVLEHLAPGPRHLEAACRRLRPGGWLALELPNCRGALARCSGRFWWQLDPPRHLELPTPAALMAVVRDRCRLQIVVARSHSRAGGFAKTAALAVEAARGREWHLSAPRPGYFRLLLRLGALLGPLADRLGRGDNFLLLARKPPAAPGDRPPW